MHQGDHSSVSNETISTFTNSVQLREYLEIIELVDLDLPQRQLKVLTQHIESMKAHISHTSKTIDNVPLKIDAQEMFDERFEREIEKVNHEESL